MLKTRALAEIGRAELAKCRPVPRVMSLVPQKFDLR